MTKEDEKLLEKTLSILMDAIDGLIKRVEKLEEKTQERAFSED